MSFSGLVFDELPEFVFNVLIEKSHRYEGGWLKDQNNIAFANL
jgi:hypothetical protein